MKTNATHDRAKAKVYAEVLLEAAQASDSVFAIDGEFSELVATVRGSIELRNTLADKTLAKEVKKSIIQEIFSGFSPELLSMLAVMVERGDIGLLSRSYELYRELAEKALDAVIIDVTTVVALDDDLRNKIVTKYSQQFGAGVLLREHIDPSLVGGIVLQAHGKRIDASVVSQLESARQVLSRT